MLGSKAKRELKITQRRILIDSIEIGIPSPQQILTWGRRLLPNGKSVGEIKNSKTVNYKRFTPLRDGLFCERIFGPVNSFTCACGKRQPRADIKFCEKCEVEYIDQRVRRNRLGYIPLLSPVAHIWYLKGRPSYISLFLGKRKKKITALAYCNAYLIEQAFPDSLSFIDPALKNKTLTDFQNDLWWQRKLPSLPELRSGSNYVPTKNDVAKEEQEKNFKEFFKFQTELLLQKSWIEKRQEHGANKYTKSINSFTKNRQVSKLFYNSVKSCFDSNTIDENLRQNPNDDLNSGTTQPFLTLGNRVFKSKELYINKRQSDSSKSFQYQILKKTDPSSFYLLLIEVLGQIEKDLVLIDYTRNRRKYSTKYNFLNTSKLLGKKFFSSSVSTGTKFRFELRSYQKSSIQQPISGNELVNPLTPLLSTEFPEIKNSAHLSHNKAGNIRQDLVAQKGNSNGRLESLKCLHSYSHRNLFLLSEQSTLLRRKAAFLGEQSSGKGIVPVDQQVDTSNQVVVSKKNKKIQKLQPFFFLKPLWGFTYSEENHNDLRNIQDVIQSNRNPIFLLSFYFFSDGKESSDTALSSIYTSNQKFRVNFSYKSLKKEKESHKTFSTHTNFKEEKNQTLSTYTQNFFRKKKARENPEEKRNVSTNKFNKKNSRDSAISFTKDRNFSMSNAIKNTEFSANFSDLQSGMNSYHRAHTLPFLPNFICKYNLREDLLKFFYSSPFTEDKPISIYCNLPRWIPLQNVQQFMSEQFLHNKGYLSKKESKESLHREIIQKKQLESSAALTRRTFVAGDASQSREPERSSLPASQVKPRHVPGGLTLSDQNSALLKELSPLSILKFKNQFQLDSIGKFFSNRDRDKMSSSLIQTEKGLPRKKDTRIRFLNSDQSELRSAKRATIKEKDKKGQVYLTNSLHFKIDKDKKKRFAEELASARHILYMALIHKSYSLKFKNFSNRIRGLSALLTSFSREKLIQTSIRFYPETFPVILQFQERAQEKKIKELCSFSTNLLRNSLERQSRLTRLQRTPSLRKFTGSTILQNVEGFFDSQESKDTNFLIKRQNSIGFSRQLLTVPVERSRKESKKNELKFSLYYSIKDKMKKISTRKDLSKACHFQIVSPEKVSSAFLFDTAWFSFSVLNKKILYLPIVKNLALAKFCRAEKGSPIQNYGDKEQTPRQKISYYSDKNSNKNLYYDSGQKRSLVPSLAHALRQQIYKNQKEKIIQGKGKGSGWVMTQAETLDAKQNKQKRNWKVSQEALHQNGIVKNAAIQTIWTEEKRLLNKNFDLPTFSSQYDLSSWNSIPIKTVAKEKIKDIERQNLSIGRLPLLDPKKSPNKYLKDYLTEKSSALSPLEFTTIREILAYTGGGALQRLLQRFDTQKFAIFLLADIQTVQALYKKKAIRQTHLSQTSFPKAFPSTRIEKRVNTRLCRRISKNSRRFKIAQLLTRCKRLPEWMLISVLPVLPPDLRPILQMSESVVLASDLNNLYQRVIYRNNRFQKLSFIDFHLVTAIQRLVQDAVDRLIENGRGGSKPFYTSSGRPLKSLSDTLKGKKGRFRLNLLGKRVDFSGRSVIVVSPNLKIHECGLPREIALELYHYFLLRHFMLKKQASSIVMAKKIIKQRNLSMWNTLQSLIYNHPVLLNRAPTLHRLGIQAFQPKLIRGNAILLHPLVCSGFNADFDGDQMGVHLPLCIQARAEAWDLLWSRNNFLSPATGQPVLVPSQDMVLGFYYMTQVFSSRSLNFVGTESRAFGNEVKESQNLLGGSQTVVNSFAAPEPLEQLRLSAKPRPSSQVSGSLSRLVDSYAILAGTSKNSVAGYPVKQVSGSVANRDLLEPASLVSRLAIRPAKLISKTVHSLEKRIPVVRKMTSVNRFFLNSFELIRAFQNGKIFLHTPVWLKWEGKIENDEESDMPLELRISSFGSSAYIYSKYKIRKQENMSYSNFYTRTTAGRVLVNQILFDMNSAKLKSSKNQFN